MSDKKNFMSTSSLTPGKMVLVGVLTLAFIGVLIMNLSGDSTPENQDSGGSRRTARRPTRRTKSKPPNAQDEKKAKTYEVDVKHWSRYDVDQIERFNPFELPQVLAAKIVSDDGADEKKQADLAAKEELEKKHAEQLRIRRERDAFLKSLRTEAAILIINSDKGRIAMIGDRRIAVGDVLPEGFRVSGINDRGLILDEVELDPSQHGGSGNGEKEQKP